MILHDAVQQAASPTYQTRFFSGHGARISGTHHGGGVDVEEHSPVLHSIENWEYLVSTINERCHQEGSVGG